MSKLVLRRIMRTDMKAIEALEISKLGIHIHFDEQDITKARAIIVGPQGTPYEDGILCFKIEFPRDYPFSPPRVVYVSTGQIRIHPNLYVGKSYNNYEGKVCLSVINTWSGPKWSSVMTIASIMISLQSVLDENPLRNEPGYETAKGQQNEVYNMIVEHDNFKTGMLQNGNLVCSETLLGAYDSFKDIIREHFKGAKPRILERCLKLQKKHPKRMECKLGTYHISGIVDYTDINERMKHALFSL